MRQAGGIQDKSYPLQISRLCHNAFVGRQLGTCSRAGLTAQNSVNGVARFQEFARNFSTMLQMGRRKRNEANSSSFCTRGIAAGIILAPNHRLPCVALRSGGMNAIQRSDRRLRHALLGVALLYPGTVRRRPLSTGKRDCQNIDQSGGLSTWDDVEDRSQVQQLGTQRSR